MKNLIIGSLIIVVSWTLFMACNADKLGKIALGGKTLTIHEQLIANKCYEYERDKGKIVAVSIIGTDSCLNIAYPDVDEDFMNERGEL